MEPEHQNVTKSSAEAEAARTRFLDSMGLGEAALGDLAVPSSNDQTEEVVLSSQPDDMEVPGISSRVSSGARVVGVQISSPGSDTDSASKEVSPTQKEFDFEQDAPADREDSDSKVPEAAIPSIASLTEVPLESEAEAKADLDEQISSEKVESDVSDENEAVEEQPAEDEETLQLHCPKCDGELVIRREHVGIEGACVWCDTKIVAAASGTDGSVRVFAVFQPDPIESGGSDVAEEVEDHKSDSVDKKDAEPIDEESSQAAEKDKDIAVAETAPEEFPEEVASEASAWSGEPIETSEAPVQAEEAVEPDLDKGATEFSDPTTVADESVEAGGSEDLDPMMNPGFTSVEAAPTEDFSPRANQFGMPSGFSDHADATTVNEVSPSEQRVAPQPFEDALQPLPSGFDQEEVPAAPDGFGEFLQSNDQVKEDASVPSQGFEDMPPSGFQDGFATPSPTENPMGETDSPFGGESQSPFGEEVSSPDQEEQGSVETFGGFEGDATPLPLDAEKDPFATSGVDAPPPLNDIPGGFASTRAEELEFGGDLPVPAPEEPTNDSGAASGFAIPATSDEDSFSMGDPFTENSTEGLESESAAASGLVESTAPWGDSPPIGTTELPAPEPEAEPAPEPEPSAGLEELPKPPPFEQEMTTGSSGLFSPVEETKEPQDGAVFGEAPPSEEVEKESAPSPEVSDIGDTMAQAIALPETASTPTVTSESIGGSPRRRPRKGLIVFLVVLIGFTCGAALASFMLPVDEYVLKARAFMEEKFDPASIQNNILPADALTPAPEVSAPSPKASNPES